MLLPLALLALWTLALNHVGAGVHLLSHGMGWLLTSRDDADRPTATVLEARVARAQRNHIENLVVFLPLALLVLYAGRGDGPVPAVLAWAYLGARVVHLATYAGGLAPLRSVSHAVTLGAQLGLVGLLLRWL